MSFKPSQESINGWLELIGKAAGLLIVLVGTVMYVVTKHPETIVFSTGALLFLGGAGVGLADRLSRPSKGSE
jgi:hypothetical protein